MPIRDRSGKQRKGTVKGKGTGKVVSLDLSMIHSAEYIFEYYRLVEPCKGTLVEDSDLSEYEDGSGGASRSSSGWGTPLISHVELESDGDDVKLTSSSIAQLLDYFA